MEIKIIAFLITIHYIAKLFFNVKSDILACGIWGWAGKSPKQFNKAKFNILGLYNDKRGGDSCGVTTDGEIYYGIGPSKHYEDFLVKNDFVTPTTYPVVIGHARKSSSGAINANNAHPFGFGKNGEGFEFVGVHNGTLHNQYELSREHEVESSVYTKNNYGTKVFDRSKNDSEILLECIYANKSFRVLSEYNGGAALLFSSTLEPNVIYAFKGASKLEKNDDGKTIYEERPLFYYIENRNSVYFSSLEESLVAIGGDPTENIFDLDHNTVYRIKNGDIAHAEKIIISRKNAFQRNFYTYAAKSNFKEVKHHNYKNNNAKNNKSKVDTDILCNIHSERIQKHYRSPIYMERLRYWRTGHLITGIYTWVNNYGFVYLTNDTKTCLKEAMTLIGKAFDLNTGDFIYNETLMFTEEDEHIVFPFNDINGIKPSLFYFAEGVLLQTELDYLSITNKYKTIYTTCDLSHMSKHPIVTIMNNRPSEKFQNILLNGEKFTGTISPLGCNKVYYIEDGNLIEDTVLEKKPMEKIKVNITPTVNISSQCLLPEKSILQTAVNKDTQTVLNLNDDSSFKKPEVEEACEVIFGNTNDDDPDEEVVKDFDDLIMPMYLSVQKLNHTLKQRTPNKIIDNIIEVNEDYLISLDVIIEDSYKNNEK